MSEVRLPDPRRSWAVLIGADRFPLADDLPDLPAVPRNLSVLQAVLTDPDAGTFEPSHCRRVDGEVTVGDVGAMLDEAVEAATDVLFVYYAGHGLVDDQGRLYLALTGTNERRVRYGGLSVDLLKEHLATSPASARILILDCCFSGRAVEAMGASSEGPLAGALAGPGFYILASTSANTPSYAPVGETHTAFTGALIEGLELPEPLTLNQLYHHVDRKLADRSLPRPQCLAGNTGGELVLVRPSGRPRQLLPGAEPTDVVHFPAKAESTFSGWTRAALGLVAAVVVFVVVFSASHLLAGASTSANLALTAAIAAGFLTIMVRRETARLTLDRRTLRVSYGRRKVLYLNWSDIAFLGEVRDRAYGRLLLVRLRPGVSIPDSTNTVMLNLNGHRYVRIGYLPACRLDDMRVDPFELRAAVERYTAGRLYRTERQMFDLDRRLPGAAGERR